MRRIGSTFGILVLLLVSASTMAQTRLSVLSFNIWGGGLNNGKPIDETVAAIRASDADIVVLQETRAESDPCTSHCPPAGPGVGAAIAAALGYGYREQNGDGELRWAGAVLSRHPIVAELGDGLGVGIDVDGQHVQVYNVHFRDWPYQPFQALSIEYSGAPFLHDSAAVAAAARATRQAGVDELLEKMAAAGPATAVFVCGDFNEPSHRDWTQAAVAAGLHPMVVSYPTVQALERVGLVDTYRAVHPDPVAGPGFTWTPTSAADDPDDHHDRIDYVMVRGEGVVVEDAAVVGEAASQADIVVTPWPSDHRAVVARVRLPDAIAAPRTSASP